MTDAQLILHHYDFSNYSEKVRLALGYKKRAWRSVIIPPVAPKPGLVPLTGGYRRTPVLQIGADIYCDTNLILRELERRWPLPSIYPADTATEARAIAYWAETQLFRPISLFVSGSHPDLFPLSLQADRAEMRGLSPPNPDSIRRAAERSAPLVRAQITLVKSMLADGRAFVLGASPTLADFAIYHALWFITARTGRLSCILGSHATIQNWLSRMQTFGHGKNSPMSTREALDVAAGTEPSPVRPSVPFPEDPPVGAKVRVRPDDYGRDVVEGTLAYIDAEEICLRREDARVGEVAVHFPRLGYDMRTT